MISGRDAVSLQCLGGDPGPPELGPELATLLELPTAVQDTFAEVLEVNLALVLDDRTETFMKRYARRHEIEPERLVPSVKACRFFFMQMVKTGAGRDAFVADVTALLEPKEASRLLDRLVPLLDAALPKLRHAAAFLSVAEHGRVVRGVRWRMDLMRSSDHSAKLDMPVATITLQYQEGPNAGQASYQLLPEQAAELRRALDALLG